MSRNLYNDLGVPKNADKKTIKRAYRSKVTKAHPDKEGGNVDEFIRLQIAYDVLMDDQKRQRYDETGLFNNKRADEEEAAVMLVQAIFQSIDSPLSQNFVKLAIGRLDLDRDNLMREINGYREKAGLFRAKAAKVKRRSPGDNLIEAALLQQADQSEKIAKNGEERLAVISKAIALGEDYKFDGDTGNAMRVTTWKITQQGGLAYE